MRERQGIDAAAGLSALCLLALSACGEPDATQEGSEEAPGSQTSESESAEESEGADNLPPPVPTLLSPPDGALDQPLINELCWNPVEDPDGDAVSYRVWIDEVELANGKTGDYGFSDTCTGPLDLVAERGYSWRVRAFEVEEPTRESEDSESWSFTTGWAGDSKVLLFDDFSEERGWSISGDASTGAWVRGTPQQVVNPQAEIAQPGSCHAGAGCYYTGDNPGGVSGEADVDGGAVVLTSPPFDPQGAQSISVSLARFFHRSDLVPTGVDLELALLVPDADAPGGTQVHVLEKLEGGEGATPANVWESVAFAACGVELAEGMRLRITARDLVTPESVEVEAAVDEVLVEGYPDTDICAPGPGALCDPDSPELACGPDLLCCAQGPLYDGVFRCETPVPEIGDQPPAQEGGPLTGPLGCNAPDFTVLDTDLDIYTQLIFVAPDSCSLYEGCVDGTGWRRVLRFDTKIANVGARDMVLGVPANHPDLFTYSPCHAHYHFDDYARYELRDPMSGELVAEGHKQAFCLVDWESWAWPELSEEDRQYTCFNQGLKVGWSDTYEEQLDCQWIDVTGLEPGDYTLRMEVNLPPEGKANATLVERRYDNNVLELPVVVED